jgi:hypothetical protein
MASNAIPQSYDPLIELMEDAADGAATHGAAIGLEQNKENAIRRDLHALIGRPAGPGGTPPSLPGLKALVNIARANKSAKTAALRVAQSNGRTLAMAAIGTLKPVLGTTWNSQWNAAGFTDGSLAVPANPMVKLQQLRAYYIANPAKEVPNVNGIACTAANCEALAQTISTAQSESNQSNSDAGAAQKNLDDGIVAGRRRMTGLREELTQLLDDNDDRWYAFGFDRPSDASTPEIPENVTATPGAAGSGSVFINFDDARRATGYRVIVTNTVGGAELANVLAQDSEAMIERLPVGATVSITVTARNATGESQPTAPITAAIA